MVQNLERCSLSVIAGGLMVTIMVGMGVGAQEEDDEPRWGYPSEEGLVHSYDYKSNLLVSSSGFRDGLLSSSKIADSHSFPALNRQGLAMARIDFGPKGLNPPHKHPGVTEVLFVVQGSLLVGFVDDTANNTLFQQTLATGDLFIFPRGLVHYQLNMDMDKPAMAISALNSANPGVSQLATNSLSP